jgi:hypothetical protein
MTHELRTLTGLMRTALTESQKDPPG